MDLFGNTRNMLYDRHADHALSKARDTVYPEGIPYMRRLGAFLFFERERKAIHQT